MSNKITTIYTNINSNSNKIFIIGHSFNTIKRDMIITVQTIIILNQIKLLQPT